MRRVSGFIRLFVFLNYVFLHSFQGFILTDISLSTPYSSLHGMLCSRRALCVVSAPKHLSATASLDGRGDVALLTRLKYALALATCNCALS